MTDSLSYWEKTRIARRSLLRAAAAGGAGLAALSLAGCGGSGGKTATPATTPTASAALDSTKGKPGGKFVLQAGAYPGTLVLVRTNNGFTAQLAGMTHNGLLEFRNGRPIVPGYDISVDPDLAQALPERPDPLTFAFKLKNAKFQNGRTVVADDVKYSYERYAFSDQSAYRSAWTWLDKVETPDPQSVVVKVKAPFAEALQSMAARVDAFVLAKEHEEGPDAASKLMGSGPFIFVEAQAPIVTRFRRNPDYFDKPYPYFNEVEILGEIDPAKKVADFAAHQVHMTYWYNEQDRDQVKAKRPDAKLFPNEASSYAHFPRIDQPPFNDKRIRQALSMTINRKAIRDGVSEGEGQDDQVLSPVSKQWGFRKPSELGASAKFWVYDPQAAKQLLSAAGITQPIEANFIHWDSTSVGQGFVDETTLAATNWRTLGIANLKDITISAAQGTTTYGVGNYEGNYFAPNGMHQSPTLGTSLRNQFFSPPEGVKPPTVNTQHINDQQLSALVDKQLQQYNDDERKQTFKLIEDLLADQMYRICHSTHSNTYFADPTLRNNQTPKFANSGSEGYVKYWWFA